MKAKMTNSDAFFYYNKGYQAIDSNQLDTAIQNFNEAIELDKSGNCGTGIDGMAYNEIGYTYFLKRNLDKALEYYKKCLEINNNCLLGYQNRSNVYILLKEHQKAIDDLSILLAKEPNIPIAYFMRGDQFREINNFEAAKRDYESFLQLTKNEPALSEYREWAKERIKQIKNNL